MKIVVVECVIFNNIYKLARMLWTPTETKKKTTDESFQFDKEKKKQKNKVILLYLFNNRIYNDHKNNTE